MTSKIASHLKCNVSGQSKVGIRASTSLTHTLGLCDSRCSLMESRITWEMGLWHVFGRLCFRWKDPPTVGGTISCLRFQAV